MAGFTARTLDAISRVIRGDLRRELPGTDAALPGNVLYVLAKVFAMAIHLVELRAEWLYRQIFVSTADGVHVDRHGQELGLIRKPASRATGVIALTGAPDTVYPAGIIFTSGNARYVTSGEGRASLFGYLQMPVQALERGAAGNRSAGDVLTLEDADAFATLSATATADNGLGGGADAEGDESFRARVLDRKRRPPQGGAVSDYEQFARAVPGVSKAWAWSFARGPGTILVMVLFEGRINGIPILADLRAVQGAIDARRMIRVSARVEAPRPEPLNVVIGNLARDTMPVRLAIEAALRTMLLERAMPGISDAPFSLSRSWVSEAISGAVDENRHVLIEPAADIIYTDGRYAVLGTVSYV